MEQKSPHEALSAAECATRTGLTIRALRLYERHGLIKPYRTNKNWRIYRLNEIERLNEIIILKGFGLPLAQIAQLLAGKQTSIETLLAVQAEALTQQKKRIDINLATIAKLRSELSVGGASVSTLVQLAKEITMNNSARDQIAWKRYEQARPRNEIKLSADVLKQYVGFFRLDDAVIITINAIENGIEISLTGQPFFALHPEALDKFFSKQIPLQFTFEQNETGNVSSLTLHQSGMEILATRISEEEAKIASRQLEARVSGNIPLPASERVLRTIITEAQSEIFNETRFSPELAQAIRDQIPVIGREFAKLGAMKAVAFKGVAPDGFDVYDVNFENGDQNWRIYMPDDRIVSGLFFRPNL